MESASENPLEPATDIFSDGHFIRYFEVLW